MSLQTTIGNISAGAENIGQAGLAWASGRLESALGTIKTGLGSIWDGGFIGISEERLNSELIPEIQKYCEKIESTINQFNAEADVTAAFAGADVQGPVSEFIGAVKEILAAYVSTMRQEIAAAQGAYQQYQSGARAVASNVAASAQEIRGAASGIRLD